MEADIIHIRPRFSFEVNQSPEELKKRLQDQLDEEDNEILGYIVMGSVVLNVPEREQHYWSPQISFQVDEVENDPNKSHVHGLIGPRPNVWTMFMFIYFLIGVVGLFTCLFGLTKWNLGEFHPAVWAGPAAIVLMSTAYIASQYGQKLGHDQVEQLKEFVRKAIKSS